MIVNRAKITEAMPLAVKKAALILERSFVEIIRCCQRRSKENIMAPAI